MQLSPQLSPVVIIHCQLQGGYKDSALHEEIRANTILSIRLDVSDALAGLGWSCECMASVSMTLVADGKLTTTRIQDLGGYPSRPQAGQSAVRPCPGSIKIPSV